MAIIAVALLVIGGGYFAMKNLRNKKLPKWNKPLQISAHRSQVWIFLCHRFRIWKFLFECHGATNINWQCFFRSISKYRFSYDASNINITAPSISADSLKFDMPSIPKIFLARLFQPADPAPSAGAAEPSVDCSLFAMRQSCSYVPAGQARDTCLSSAFK